MCSLCEVRKSGFEALSFEGVMLDGANGLVSISRLAHFTDGNGAATNTSAEESGKPSFDYDEAALQISRWDIKWDDGNAATGDIEGGFFNPKAFGSPGTVTYGYLSNAGVTALGSAANANHQQFTQAQITNVELAITRWEGIANIDFVRVGGFIDSEDDAEMAIMGEAGTNGGFASITSSGRDITDTLVSIGQSQLSTFGSYAWLTSMHELGHALGLPHPGDYDGEGANYTDDAEFFEDTVQYTVMSYFDEDETGANYGAGRHAGSPMLYDVAAIQRLYGKNTTTFSTDTTYGFNSNTGDEAWDLDDGTDYILGAIWDVGGIDTIDMSGHTFDQIIDLNELAFSSTRNLTDNIAIARDVKIENAVGGSGDDLLIGNDDDPNHIDAMFLDTAGDPVFGAEIGYSGANDLFGGAGSDTLIGNAGDDLLYGDDGNDLLFGDAEEDVSALLASLGL